MSSVDNEGENNVAVSVSCVVWMLFGSKHAMWGVSCWIFFFGRRVKSLSNIFIFISVLLLYTGRSAGENVGMGCGIVPVQKWEGRPGNRQCSDVSSTFVF